jgi:hypothetical protein
MNAIQPRHDGAVGEPIDLDTWVAWSSSRAVLTRLGCPDRLPESLGIDCFGWDDDGDLPTHLRAKRLGLPVSITGEASAAGVNYLLHAYQAGDGTVVLLQLCEAALGRSLTAWLCGDQREAAQIAAEQAVEWGWIGLKFSLNVAEAPDDDEALGETIAWQAAA